MREFNRRSGGQRPEDIISASEIASFVYCPEQWRLEYGLGLPAENQTARNAGTRHHARNAAAERLAGWAIGLGLAIVADALVLLVLWVLTR
jgi:hypothetical protein